MRGVLREEARILGCNDLVSFSRRRRSAVEKCKAIIALYRVDAYTRVLNACYGNG